MDIVGVGTDLVEVARFERLLRRGGRRFLDRWFRAAEIEYCIARGDPHRHVAARFAAKEAVLKSLRLPRPGPARWREIEVTRDVDGLPGVALHGSMWEAAAAAGVVTVHVSLSHGGTYASATATAVGRSGGPEPAQPPGS
ncbi:holo-[acyl-carrier-protein] synthase [Pseudactinotalea sp. HY160]|uniref:holo-ACP synthase n=1 Tax=Pseudactinotalea sp. HY160 TaxID=2654490 RepID=UPI00128D497C|nr:holo-[acyl-carrier-protein] synthase [Pseudactinotalea sp. HY160]